MKIIFNPVHGEELQLLAQSTDISIIDTRANVLAETPDAGTIAFATDVSRFYIYDGSNWKGARLSFGTPSTGVDMGAFPYEDDSGYGEVNLSNKRLHNIILSYFDESAMIIENGAIRYSSGFLQIYVDGFWLNVYPLTAFEYADRMLWSDDWQEYDLYGKNIIHGNKIDMGVFASDHLIDGGLISEQVVT